MSWTPTIVRPADWGCPPPKKRQIKFDSNTKKAIGHHWIGDIALDESYPADARMRNIVQFEMRRWSTGAYDYGVAPDGTIFGLHQMESESFAEGPIPRKQTSNYWRGDIGWWPEIYSGNFREHRSFNRYHVSILWLCGANFIPPDPMVQAVINLERWILQQVPNIKCVVPHSGLRRKSCPGPAITQLIDDQTLGPSPGLGMFAPWPWLKPQAPPPTPPRHSATPEPAISDREAIGIWADAHGDLEDRVGQLETWASHRTSQPFARRRT